MATLIQRPLKGSRISTFYPVKSLPSLSSLDSAFQLQEYISLLIRLDVHDVEGIVSLPGKQSLKDIDLNEELRGDEKENEKDGKNEVVVDDGCWVYEQLRRLAQDLSHPLITMLQQECTRATCPEMKAGEWLYLCVAHGSEGAMEQCCAIDYILHTLDSATALLNSPRAFPSRLSVPPTSRRHFSSLARRLGRIFAHAYFHHREAFEQAEAESSLYARFLALTSKFNLVPSEFLVIPPRLSNVHDDAHSDRNMDSRDASTEIDPHRFLGPDSQIDRSLENRPWTIAGSGSMVDLGLGNNNGRGLSPPGPINRTESPRRFGRSRTDTMVYSEAVNVAEELARGEGLFDADIDRAIAEQRTLGGSGQVAFPATTPEPTKPSAEETSQEYPATVPADVQNTSEHAGTSHEEPTPAPLAQSILEIAEPAPTEPYIPVDAEEEEPLSPDEEDLPDATTAVPELSFSAAEEEEVEAQLGTTPEIRVEAPESERDAPSAIQPEAQPPQAESVKEEPSTQQTSEPEAKDDTDVSPDVILKQEDIPEEAETEGKEEKDESPKVVDHSEAAADTQVSPEPVPPSSSEDLNEVTEGKEIEKKLEVS